MPSRVPGRLGTDPERPVADAFALEGQMARLVVILVVALIIFGPQDLPRIARSLWRASDELRRVSAELSDALHRELEALEQEDATHPPTI